MKNAFLFLALLAVTPAFATNSAAIPPDAGNYTGYLYKTTSDGTDLFLDVFTPPHLDRAKPVPVIIFFDGGGWDHGDKDSIEPECRYFAQRGLVTVSVNYRFMDPRINKEHLDLGDAKSICVKDGKSAIRWVRAHAAALGGDPTKVILGGDSAGTEIALISALDHEINDTHDYTGISTSALAFLLWNPAFQRSPKEDPRLEPYPYVGATLPPSILFSGDKDGFKVNADQFVADCKNAGAVAEMWVAPGQLHGALSQRPWLASTCFKADAFLVRLGLLAGAPSPLPSTAPELLTANAQ